MAQNSLQESDPENICVSASGPRYQSSIRASRSMPHVPLPTSGGWSNISETEKCQHRPYTQRDKEYTIT
ncbi:hypothetical protein PHYPO_G00030280 [Pangasianodon hypophthalmus]|uniref:Uncharacterized protein n=1 Tax=Pangasianodon hypophthalmus TaxID=310915 RepID=A0A5N5MJU3_PANHP|nr:hypothetical protein PHYPO_G00030280 [Pangasianodon hypophthalmus]